MITIKDIAREAGVSYATVSRALNNRDDVNPQTRARIHELAKAMGYQPNRIAQSLVKRGSNTIACVVPDIANPYFGTIAKVISNAAAAAGVSTIISNTGWDPIKENEVLHLVEENRVAGMIIKPTAYYEPGTFSNMGIPVVVFWHPTEDDQSSYIDVDHWRGAELAVDHLIERGFQKIAYVGGVGTSPANQIRQMSWQATLQRHHLQAYPELISQGDFNPKSGYNQIRQIFETSPIKPDAVFCGNDFIAMGILQYTREQGLEVPGKFGIVGYDDMRFSSLPMVNLTTVRQPLDFMGKEAFRLLRENIEGKPAEERQNVLVEPILIVRGT